MAAKQPWSLVEYLEVEYLKEHTDLSEKDKLVVAHFREFAEKVLRTNYITLVGYTSGITAMLNDQTEVWLAPPDDAETKGHGPTYSVSTPGRGGGMAPSHSAPVTGRKD